MKIFKLQKSIYIYENLVPVVCITAVMTNIGCTLHNTTIFRKLTKWFFLFWKMKFLICCGVYNGKAMPVKSSNWMKLDCFWRLFSFPLRKFDEMAEITSDGNRIRSFSRRQSFIHPILKFPSIHAVSYYRMFLTWTEA